MTRYPAVWSYAVMEARTTPPCTETAPDALCGHLGRLQCTLQRHHRGDHRSHKTISKVGKVIVKWRQSKPPQPPVIELPPARMRGTRRPIEEYGPRYEYE